MPKEIWDLIDNGARVCGHNAAFEDAIDTLHVDTICPFAWHVPTPHQLDCTMARAAVQGLPLELGGAGDAMDMAVRKDTTGHRLMLTMCKPRRRQAGEDRKAVYWNYDQIKITRMTSYCVLDVKTEIGIDRVLRPLQDQERPVWQLDQMMNNRGVEIDLDFSATPSICQAATVRVNKRLKRVTGGAVTKVTQVERIKEFARWRGVEFKETVKRRRTGESYITEAADKEGLMDFWCGRRRRRDRRGRDRSQKKCLRRCPANRMLEWRPGDEPSVRAAFELRLEAGRSSLQEAGQVH